MPTFSFEVTGDREVELKFEQFPQHAHDRLFAAITSLTARLEAAVKGAEPFRTGKLRGETTSALFDDTDRIAGLVRVAAIGAEAGKAAALEYGAHGIAHVKAHYSKLDHVFRRFVSPMTVMVEAYSRQVDISEDNFLRGPLAAMEPDIMAELQQALVDAGAAT